MHRDITGWFSQALSKDMPIASYGHYGPALLLIPTAAADFLEYERFQLLDQIKGSIEGGKVKVFSVDSINNESWLNKNMHPEHRALRHEQWNQYIYNEVIPFIRSNTSEDTPIITCGASFGALHSMNLFLKRPDLIRGVVAMSGVYNLMEYTDSFYNDTVYFNSPSHYIPNMTDHNTLEAIRSGKILIATGSGSYEDPHASRDFSTLLHNKSISHHLSIWGQEWTHDWPTWRAMLPWVMNEF